MQAPEGLRNVAVPANGPMRDQGLLKILERNLVPLKRFPLLIDQGRRMIVPVNLTKRLLTVGALHSFVPAADNIGDQTSPGCFLDLRQTVLAATGLFRPARAC